MVIMKCIIVIQWTTAALRTTLDPFYSCKSSWKCKSRDSFGICTSWGFWNTPKTLKLTKFCLRYLKSKTTDNNLKISSKFYISENCLWTLISQIKIDHFQHLLSVSKSWWGANAKTFPISAFWWIFDGKSKGFRRCPKCCCRPLYLHRQIFLLVNDCTNVPNKNKKK